jgi:type II secretory pathway component PulM
MDCRQAVLFMHERLSGSAEAGGDGFDSHILECGRCRAHYRALLELTRTATSIEPVAPPASLRRRVAEAVAPRPAVKAADRRWLAAAMVLFGCAVLALGMAYRPLWQPALARAALVEGALAGDAAAPAAAAAAVWDLVAVRLPAVASHSLGNAAAAVPISAAALGAIVGSIILLLGANAVLIRIAAPISGTRLREESR